ATPKDEVVLRLESGGGMVHSYGLASSQLARIRQAGIPLTICIDKVAASGGYMMACIGNRIISAPFAVLGSIGVVAQLPNVNRLLKKHDIDFEVLTAGEYKRTLTVFGENTEKGREKFQEDLDITHELFKNFVASYRPQLQIDEVATGEVWLGLAAKDKQLVDELKTSDEYLSEKAKTSDVFHLHYAERRSLQQRVGLAATASVDRLVTGWWAKLTQQRFWSRRSPSGLPVLRTGLCQGEWQRRRSHSGAAAPVGERREVQGDDLELTGVVTNLLGLFVAVQPYTQAAVAGLERMGVLAPQAQRHDQVSSMTSLFLMIRCIDALLERVDADALIGVDEALVFVAFLDINVDQLLDNVRHGVLCEGRTQDFAQAGVATGAAAQRHLIELFAFLVHAQNADMADVVVATGVHAARNIQVQLTNVEEVIQVIKPTLDRLGNRNRLGIGQRAEVAAGAADDVRQQTDVWRCKALLAQLAPHREQLALLDVGENHVLFMGGAQLPEAIAVGQNLDARLVLVVTTAVAVVDPQDGVEVAQQVLPRQKLVDERADHRRTPETTTDQHAEAQLAGGILHRLQTDVMDLDRGAVGGRAVDRDFEFARQVGEFRVECRPLADDFTPGARVYQLIGGHAGELVRGDVAQAVAAGLDGVHLHGGQLGENVGNVFKRRPVELHVLAGADVCVAFVVVAGNLGQHAGLTRGELAVGHSHAQHRGEALDVEAVLQAKRAELFFAELAGQIAAGLVAELLDAVLDDPLIVLVVYVHGGPVLRRFTAAGQARKAMRCRLLSGYRANLRARPRTPCGAGGGYQFADMRKSEVWRQSPRPRTFFAISHKTDKRRCNAKSPQSHEVRKPCRCLGHHVYRGAGGRCRSVLDDSPVAVFTGSP
nr:hypothetical protein [Tanacetum cinerariifolium]